MASGGAYGYGATAGAGGGYGSYGLPERPLTSEHSLLRSGGSSAVEVRSRVNIWELIAVPWVFLALVLACFLQAGTYGYYLPLFVIPVVLLVLNSWFLVHHYKRGRNAEVVLGILTLTAISISLCVGLYAVVRNLSEYRRLSQGASYFNVLPSEPAAGKMDATTLVFTNTTLVDVSRTFGFTDARGPIQRTFCVAPVANGELHAKRVQFWAAGVNCCEARSNFGCFDLHSAGKHGAIVLPKAAQEDEGFRDAVRGAQAAYLLEAGGPYMLVHWLQDPVGYRDNLWNSSATLFLVFGSVYLVISTMIGIALLPTLTAK